MNATDPAALLLAIEHYLSAGMRWGVLTRLINGRFGTAFTSKELQAEYKRLKEAQLPAAPSCEE